MTIKFMGNPSLYNALKKHVKAHCKKFDKKREDTTKLDSTKAFQKFFHCSKSVNLLSAKDFKLILKSLLSKLALNEK